MNSTKLRSYREIGKGQSLNGFSCHRLSLVRQQTEETLRGLSDSTCQRQL